LKKKIYLISGLGADERIFEFLIFEDYEPIHIKWIRPKQQETINAYALRLSEQIETENPLILGVSFGGMIATEIAKQIDCQQVILISSAKTKNEIPILYRLIGRLNLHRLMPIQLFKQANFITYWFFGMKTKTEKKLLKSILTETDSTFLKWAINSIIHWDNKQLIERQIHIHGSRDRILPKQNIKTIDFEINEGGHLMIYNKANDINLILKNIL
jgi:pimeloyl-ACP methyl ester carboxylesterase